MKITQAKDPIFVEECNEEGLHPVGYFPPPVRFVEPDTEGRLISILRDATNLAIENTLEALVNAVLAYIDGDPELAFAMADLTVSGKEAFRLFSEENPNDVQLINAVNDFVDVTIDLVRLSRAVAEVLDRAYEALWTIRHRYGERRLGWIAVWAEIDSPHRPVNVPGTHHTQYDIEVPVRRNKDAPARTIKSRFTIFDNHNLPEAIDIDSVIGERQLPTAPIPSINSSSQLLCYIHGHSSRLEEGEKLGNELLNSGPYTLISMDLPCNGYADMFDHIEIAPDTDTDTLESFPLLNLIEQYVIDFIRTIGTVIGSPIEEQIAAVIGGSLGGNTSILLAKRDMDEHPWLTNFIAWSAASVWTPYTGIIRETGPNTARARMQERDFPERRREYITQVFDDSTRIFSVRPQGEYWYRDDGWEPCKTLYLRGAREDRREIYNENFRRWHWRVALEQMLFSHRHPVSRLEKVNGRLLLMAAEGDDYPWTHIHDATRDMAMLMINTPGTLRRLRNTGHSIHDERPIQLANEINNFLPSPKPSDVDEERWVGWQSLNMMGFSTPAIATNEDGTLSVFVLGENGKIWRSNQNTINGNWSTDWIQIRGGLDDGDRLGTSIAVERNWDGRLEIFSLYENENWVAHVWQNDANGTWHNWDKGNHINQLIGGGTDSVFAVERFGESPGEILEDGLRFDVGRRWLLVGAIRTNGRIHIRGQNNFGWWTNGRDIGNADITIQGVPCATRLMSGLLIIIARDTSDRLLYIRETSPDNWETNWNVLEGISPTSDASATLEANGRLVIAVRDDSGHLSLIREVVPGREWGRWEQIEAGIAENATPIVVTNAWGELQVFVRWTDGSIRSKRQRLGVIRSWTDWNNLGGSFTRGPVVDLGANGMPVVFCIGADQQVHVNTLPLDTIRIVTAVIRDEHRITHLCNTLTTWSPISVDQVIEEILGNDRTYILRTSTGLTNRIIVRQILTTSPDTSLENNLENLPITVDVHFTDTGMHPSESSISKRVTHTIRRSDNSMASIIGLHNAEEGWSVGKATAIRQILEGTQQYHIELEGGEINDIIAREFLTTIADDSTENNLDSLPDC